MKSVIKDAGFSVIRSLFLVVGSYAAAKGYGDAATIAGAGTAIASAIWGVADKFVDKPRKRIYSQRLRKQNQEVSNG